MICLGSDSLTAPIRGPDRREAVPFAHCNFGVMPQRFLWARESEMLAWLNHRRETAGRLRAESDALIHDVGVDAFSEARRRQRETKSRAEGKNWARVAIAVVQRTSKGFGLGAATRMATEAGVVTIGEGAPSPGL